MTTEREQYLAGLVSIQADALKTLVATVKNMRCPQNVADVGLQILQFTPALAEADAAISATAETVAKYKAEQQAKWNEESNSLIGQQDITIESLRREVAILNADNKSLLSIAIRCHDVFKTYGHLYAGLSADLLEVIKQSTQHIFHQQATAQSYEQEAEQRGAVKALEEAADWFNAPEQDAWDVAEELRRMATSKKAG